MSQKQSQRCYLLKMMGEGKTTLKEAGTLMGVSYRRAKRLKKKLNALAVTSIFALTPPAKGRIERLLGVLQNRLIAGMDLRDIKEMDAGNQEPQKDTRLVSLPPWQAQASGNQGCPSEIHLLLCQCPQTLAEVSRSFL